jgi:hypothetical protein
MGCSACEIVDRPTHERVNVGDKSASLSIHVHRNIRQVHWDYTGASWAKRISRASPDEPLIQVFTLALRHDF